jgi:hypothetical protein
MLQPRDPACVLANDDDHEHRHGNDGTHSASDATAEQLNAHLGVGVPKVWSPVDEGEARLWVPDDWFVNPQGTCDDDALAARMISIGKVPQACPSSRLVPIPKQLIALVPSSQIHVRMPALTVHCHRIYNIGDTKFVLYDVPQLKVRIAANGRLSRRIINTLAQSASYVALNAAYEVVPNDWHAVTEKWTRVVDPPIVDHRQSRRLRLRMVEFVPNART